MVLFAGALEISLSRPRRATAYRFVLNPRILFYTQTAMKKCEMLHMARVINCGQGRLQTRSGRISFSDGRREQSATSDGGRARDAVIRARLGRRREQTVWLSLDHARTPL